MKDRIYFCFYDGDYCFRVYQESEDNGFVLLYEDDYSKVYDPFKKFFHDVAYGMNDVITEDNTMDNVLTIYLDDKKLTDTAVYMLKLCQYFDWTIYIIQDSVMNLVKLKETKDEAK